MAGRLACDKYGSRSATCGFNMYKVGIYTHTYVYNAAPKITFDEKERKK